MKQYTHKDVRASFHHPDNPSSWGPNTVGYIRLSFSYGLKTIKGGKTKYHPLSYYTGLQTKLKDWPKRGEMTPDWINDNNDLFFKILEQKKAIINAYERACQTLGRPPFPAEITRILKGEVNDKTAPVRFVEWASEHITNVKLNPRTVSKYRTAIEVVRAVELARTRPDFKRFGSGPIYLQTFSLNDWKDLDNLLDMTSVPVTVAIREGAEGLQFNPEQPFYSQNTKQKFQSNVKALLRMADNDDYPLTVKLHQLKTCSIPDKSDKTILNADQLKQLIEARFPTNPHRENARRLMVLQFMVACRYGDLRQYLNAKLEGQKVDGRTFYTIDTRSWKGDRDQLIPVFTPALEILQGERPWMVSNQKLLDHYKQIAKDLGWTDEVTLHTYRAFGSKGIRVDKQVRFDDVLGTHTMRRTCYSLMRKMIISPDLVALMGGWKVSVDDDVHYKYNHLPPVQKAKALLDEVEERQHQLPFKMVA